jgi:hypothetical protein
MRFSEFLRVTVLLSAAAASALGVVTLAAASSAGDDVVVPVAAVWWLLASVVGSWLGRRPVTSTPIASLLSSARTQASLPELHPTRTVLNRLWPLLVCTVGAGGLSLLAPQIPAIAAGFAIIWSLAWRRQSHAVTAIEERDGARFYVQPTSPLAPIRLVRTPGFRSNLLEFDDPGRRGRIRPRA